jgi:hypothetical protein
MPLRTVVSIGCLIGTGFLPTDLEAMPKVFDQRRGISDVKSRSKKPEHDKGRSEFSVAELVAVRKQPSKLTFASLSPGFSRSSSSALSLSHCAGCQTHQLHMYARAFSCFGEDWSSRCRSPHCGFPDIDFFAGMMGDCALHISRTGQLLARLDWTGRGPPPVGRTSRKAHRKTAAGHVADMLRCYLECTMDDGCGLAQICLCGYSAFGQISSSAKLLFIL